MKRLACTITPVVLLLLMAAPGRPQEGKHESQLRTVRGFVVDRSDSPISDAIVYLKNLRTNQVRSYISENDGRYRFSGLDPNVDYEIHAEKDRAKSPTRTVSSFDSRKEIVITLKIEKRKR